MTTRRRARSQARRTCASAIAAAVLASCGAIDLDETDRHALFLGARVRKELEGAPDDHVGAHVEAEWRSVHGDTDALDYSIETAALGLGFDRTVGEKGWVGLVGGLAWEGAHFDAEPQDFDDLNGVGPYAAVQGGLRLTPWLEPYARAGVALYLPDFGNDLSGEAGLRFHAFERASLFVGWRYVTYNFGDLDDLLVVDTLELDSSGLVVVLEVGF